MATKFLSLANLTSIKNSLLDLLYKTTNISIPLDYWKTSSTAGSEEVISLKDLISKIITLSTGTSKTVSASTSEIYFIKRYLFGKTRVYNDSSTFIIDRANYYLGSIYSAAPSTENNTGDLNIVLYSSDINIPKEFTVKLLIRIGVDIANMKFTKQFSKTVYPVISSDVNGIPHAISWMGSTYSSISENDSNVCTLDISDFRYPPETTVSLYAEENFGNYLSGTINIINVMPDDNQRYLHYEMYFNDVGGQQLITLYFYPKGMDGVKYKTYVRNIGHNNSATEVIVGDGGFYKVDIFTNIDNEFGGDNYILAIVTKLA